MRTYMNPMSLLHRTALLKRRSREWRLDSRVYDDKRGGPLRERVTKKGGYHWTIRACIANIIEEHGIPIELSWESAHAIKMKRFVQKVPKIRATCPKNYTSTPTCRSTVDFWFLWLTIDDLDYHVPRLETLTQRTRVSSNWIGYHGAVTVRNSGPCDTPSAFHQSSAISAFHSSYFSREYSGSQCRLNLTWPKLSNRPPGAACP